LSPHCLLCRCGTHLFGSADELRVLRESHVLRAAAAALRTARPGTCAPRRCGTGCHALSWPIALGGRKPPAADPRAWKALSFPARCADRDRTLRPDPARVAPAAGVLRCHAEQPALYSDELVHRAGRLAVLASDARSAAPPAFAPAPAAPLLLPLPRNAAHDPGLSGPRVLAEQLVSGLLGVRTVPADFAGDGPGARWQRHVDSGCRAVWDRVLPLSRPQARSGRDQPSSCRGRSGHLNP